MSGSDDLVALIASRICHDLANPLGAIGNGVELMALTGGNETPEMQLVNESVVNARARLRFSRIAFGAAVEGQMVPARDLREAISATDRKSDLVWTAEDMSRRDAKLLLLMLSCLDNAMPYGGQIHVARTGGSLMVVGTSERFLIGEEDWALLDGGQGVPAPAKVHFALLPVEAAAQGRTLVVDRTGTEIRIAA